MTQTFSVTLNHQGQTIQVQVAADTPILEAALEQGVSLPYSCSSGVCTTCAAQVRSGHVRQSDALGIAPTLQAKGYVLLCVAYPESDLVIDTEKEDEVYQQQFGSSRR
ncbi:MAG: 2Fe-2S iron-sulfur cluster-binding protein [Synechococcales cyanobacterium]